MKRSLMTLFLLLASSLALTAAQSGQQSSSGQHGRDITITGCLQQGSSPDSFMLSNAKSSEMSQRGQYDPSQSQPSAEGQTESGMPAEMARTENDYMLVPEGTVDLRSHIGKRVEITGEMMSPAESGTESGTTTPSTGRATRGMSAQPQVKVHTVREIAQSCE